MKLDRRAFMAGAAALSLTPARAQTQPRIIEARDGGYDGAVPGPLLRLRKGEALNLRLVNKLDQPTSIHWRGVRAPNAFDGVAPLNQKPVPPGESFDIGFTPPDSGTFFYHAHTEPHMMQQVERGLCGVLIVEEPDAPDVDHDVLAIIGDQMTGDQTGSCAGRPALPVSINGKSAPEKREAAPRARIRLRLVNAASARIMTITLEGAQPYVIAIDGQPCRAFEPLRNSVPIAPGARFDVVFDMPEQVESSVRVTMRGASADPGVELAVFTARGSLQAARPPIAAPAENPLLPVEIKLQSARRLDLALEAVGPGDPGLACSDGQPLWRLSPPKPVKAGAPLLSVKRGSVVSLGFVNRSQVNQAMRLHGHVMRQLHLMDDGWEPYWRDSVIVPAGRTVRVAFVADNPGRWRIGSGIMAHAAGGMSGFFEVS